MVEARAVRPSRQVACGVRRRASEHLVGVQPGALAPIIGDPVLADGLRADLAFEMIPYTAEELIAIGMEEFEAIEAEFRIVARDMGFGDDWKAALEHTKNLAPPPGENAMAHLRHRRATRRLSSRR